MKSQSIYLLHGMHGSPKGTVAKIQAELEPLNPGVEFVRPMLPCHDPNIPARETVNFLKKLEIPKNSIVIAVSLGGLAAAKLQEESRPDLRVICLNSPTRSRGGDVELYKKMPNRIVFYSSTDEVIAGRVEAWPKLAEAHDLAWLTHDPDDNLDKLAKLFQKYIDYEKRNN